MSDPAPIAATVGVVLVGLTGAALAHAELKSATPAVNGTLSVAPAKIDLSFDEGVNLAFTGVVITGPDNKVAPIGKATLTNQNQTRVVPISGAIAVGQYTVGCHASSADGHKTHGTYKFTVKP